MWIVGSVDYSVRWGTGGVQGNNSDWRTACAHEHTVGPAWSLIEAYGLLLGVWWAGGVEVRNAAAVWWW